MLGAKDMMYNPDDGYYITWSALVNGKIKEWIYLAQQTWFNTLDYTKTVSNKRASYKYTAHSSNGSTFAPGFYREGTGYQFSYWDTNIWTRTAVGDRGPGGTFDRSEIIQLYWGAL